MRCSEEDAAKVRAAAKSERRTVSGFILNAVLSRIDAREKMLFAPPAPIVERRTTQA